MKKLLQFWKLYQQYKSHDLVLKRLSKEDKDNIAALYINPQYKSFTQLEDGVIIDLINKTFKEAQKEEEFLAIKWVRAVIFLKQQQVKRYYEDTIKKKSAKISHEAGIEEKYEALPDEVPITI